MRTQTKSLSRLGACCLLPLVMAASQAAFAQAAVVDSAPAFASFDQWVGATVVTVTESAPAKVETVSPAIKGGAVAARYEPLPVILGAPELPLLGPGASKVARVWAPTFNYQGLFAQLLVLNTSSQKYSALPLSTKIKPGQRFKIRLISTFDGVAGIDQVVGTAFDAQRSGQVYPTAGTSVEVKAGQTVDLPVGPNQHLVLDGRTPNERLVLSVRFAPSGGGAFSAQPSYRQESKTGSSYLQLVPRGSYPIVEQVLVSGR